MIETVNARLPGWRSTRPRRTLVQQWSNRPVTVDGHEFWVASLPGVGVTWARRGASYWRRRVTSAVMFTVAAAVFTLIDIGFASAARSQSAGALAGLVVVLVLLAAAALVYYWRPDLLVNRAIPGTAPLPKPVRVTGVVLGVLGLCLTPLWVLSFLVDLLPRFPVRERAAWQMLADQQPDGWGPLAPR